MIPTSADLASDRLPVRWHDIFNPPGLTNFLGAVQVDRDLTALRNFNLPPYFTSDVVTGTCFLDGEYVAGGAPELHVTYRPDRIVREAEVAGLQARSTTVMPPDRYGAAVRLEVHNPASQDRRTTLRLALRGCVAQLPDTIQGPYGGNEIDNRATVDLEAGTVTYVAQHSEAANVQGTDVRPDRAGTDHLEFDVDLPPGATWSVTFVTTLRATAADARREFDDIVALGERVFDEAEELWDQELRAVFAGGTDRYSGTMPVLETDDEALRRLYWNGILGVICFKRTSPDSVLDRTYDTLMPRFWPTVTFLWDYSLSSTVHALLDPQTMRRMLRHWMQTDVHTCMGTEWLTGAGLGAWYSVNDYAMTRLLHDYLRWTGDHELLDEVVPLEGDPDATVADHLVRFATAYEGFVSPHGLADYGAIDNLLECVSTYVHEVASLNAANVWCLRVAADVLDRRGEPARATELRTQAKELVARVQELYQEGEGFWGARQPDGSIIPVRHCYDLLTVLYAMPDELGSDQREEMVAFFHRELESDTWMRALSTRDPDASFSIRADHQWNGAYCAWPSETATGLLQIGDEQATGEWIRRMAASANQGPFGQAHYTEQAVPPHAGGARKVNPEPPLVNDWACASNGSWARLVIEGVFGVRLDLDGNVSATPRLDGFDPDARLVGLTCQGRRYTVDREGVHEDG